MKTQELFPSENRLNIYFPYFYSLEKINGKLIFLCPLIQEQRRREWDQKIEKLNLFNFLQDEIRHRDSMLYYIAEARNLASF